MPQLGPGVLPSLLVRDLGATLAYWCDRLGFERTGAHPSADAPTWAEVRRDGVVVWFYTDPPRGTPAAPSLSGTLYVPVADVDALAAELAPRVEFVWGPEVMPYGMREFAVRDPDGYLVAFTAPA